MMDRAANNKMNAYTVHSKRGESVLIFGTMYIFQVLT
jgi:hypothetical protein